MEFSWLWLICSSILLLISAINEINTRRTGKIDSIDGGINE